MPQQDTDKRIQELETKLADANRRADAAESRVGAMELEGSTRHHGEDKKVVSATRNKPLWPFKVKCTGMPKLEVNSPRHPEIPEATISAVDESEAIRQFCLMNRDEHGRQLDATRYQFQAVCLKEGERRQLGINRTNNRRLVTAGKLPVLTREEELKSPESNLKTHGQLVGAA